jgi:hypothetical protein
MNSFERNSVQKETHNECKDAENMHGEEWECSCTRALKGRFSCKKFSVLITDFTICTSKLDRFLLSLGFLKKNALWQPTKPNISWMSNAILRKPMFSFL